MLFFSIPCLLRDIYQDCYHKLREIEIRKGYISEGEDDT
jgi:hypothetical protein